MPFNNNSINIRKKIRLGVTEPGKDGYLCELDNDLLVIECYEHFQEDTILKCEMALNNELNFYEFKVNSVTSEGLSYKLHGRVVKNLEILKKFHKEKTYEQQLKSTPKKNKWKFW